MTVKRRMRRPLAVNRLTQAMSTFLKEAEIRGQGKLGTVKQLSKTIRALESRGLLTIISDDKEYITWQLTSDGILFKEYYKSEPVKSRFSQDQVDAICAYREAGFLTSEISRAMARQGLMVTPDVVAYICSKNGALLPNMFYRFRNLKPRDNYRCWEKEEDDILRSMTNTHSINAIARRLGRDRRSVSARLRTLAIHDTVKEHIST